MLRIRIVGLVLIVGIIAMALVSAQQQQQPATLTDLLTELRGLRGEVREAAVNSMRAQLLMARLALQEGRLGSLSQQLAGVRQQLSESQIALAPFAAQLKQAQEVNSELLTPLRNMIEQHQRRDRELRAREAELSALISAEENRWMDFNSRLDEIERSLSRPQKP
jgi:hypothetical protein